MSDSFRRAVADLVNGDYTLKNGKRVKGQAFSHLQTSLRKDGWRGMGDYPLRQMLERVGFTVSRGRGERVYHGGHRNLGMECDVVHKVETPE